MEFGEVSIQGRPVAELGTLGADVSVTNCPACSCSGYFWGGAFFGAGVLYVATAVVGAAAIFGSAVAYKRMNP